MFSDDRVADITSLDAAPPDPLSPSYACLQITTQPLVLQLLTGPPPTPLALPAQPGLPSESAPHDG